MGVWGKGHVSCIYPRNLHKFPTSCVIGRVTPLFAILSLCAALVALTLSGISLVLHWIRRSATPEYAELHSQIRALNTDYLDLADKVQHWRNRDGVRKARQGAQEKLDEAAAPVTQADKKNALRSKAMAAGLGVVSR